MEGEDGGYPVKWLRAASVASLSWPANTVIMRSGRTLWRTAARTPGRILPAAHPHTEFTTTITVPFCFTAFSTSAAVRASAMPAEVNSWRMGAIIISGYILFLHCGCAYDSTKMAADITKQMALAAALGS
jgi:hypothetical protein